MSPQSNSTIDADSDAIAKGQRASVILRNLEPFLREYEDGIISNLVITAEKISDQELRVKVGELIALRRFRSRLDNDTQRGSLAAGRR